MSVDQRIVPPGRTIGIIGGGQLGRMTALAAAQLGYRCHVFSSDPDSPAFQVVAEKTVAAYDDAAALARFAAAVDVVTFEFENIPAQSVKTLENLLPVRPGGRALAIAQERIAEKTFLNDLTIATTPWHPVRDRAELDRAVARIGRPAVLKTVLFGYDGKGQIKIETDTDLDHAWRQIGAEAAILEAWVAFRYEMSVIVARGIDGRSACFDAAENRHRDHILHTTVVPARAPPGLARQAQELARRIADELDLVGLLAVEMFVTAGDTLLVNELAPRPHNSGHWTMDACGVDQFEQFVRAVCGLPLGCPDRHADATMTNLIGDESADWLRYFGEAGTHLHLYGKAESRPGRKMGHVTRLRPKSEP